jgi:hypothetical protein
MRYTFTILFLLWPALAWGQDIVLGAVKPTPDQVDKAKAVLAAAEDRELNWKVGQFSRILKGPAAQGQLTWDVTDETILSLQEVPANTLLLVENGWMAGEDKPRDHEFKPEAVSYYRAKAVKPGRTIIKVWANGEGGKPPVVIAKLDVTVIPDGPKPPTPPPGPDIPPDNPDADATLVKEFRDLLAKDKALNNGPWDKAKLWAKSYVDTADMLGIADPAFPQPKTLEQLYEGHKAIWLSAQVPTLPFLQNTRGRISEMMTTAFGKVESSPVDREKAAKHYRRIGLALLEALK